MLVNLSNHPSTKWSVQQFEAAQVYGKVTDLPFPEVNPSGDEEYIRLLCDEYVKIIDGFGRDDARNISAITVHIMGEMTFTFAMVSALQQKDISCIASTTQRISSEANGVRTSEFQFVKFREYH